MNTMASNILEQRAPLFPIQRDMALSRRLGLGFAGLAIAIAAGIDALAAFSASERGVFRFGLGRLTDYLLDQQMPGAELLAFAERGHLSAMFAIGALLLIFGRSASPQPGAGQIVVFHRRSGFRRQLPALFLGIGLLVLGGWIAVSIHPLLAGLVEFPATMLIGWFAWHACIPEMRCALTVIADTRQGFANRVEISGGLFNKIGKVTVRHDDLVEAIVMEPSWTRMFSHRDLLLWPRTQTGGWRIDAIAPAAEASELAGYLNGDFKYALSPAGLNWSSRFMGANGGQWM